MYDADTKTSIWKLHLQNVLQFLRKDMVKHPHVQRFSNKHRKKHKKGKSPLFLLRCLCVLQAPKRYLHRQELIIMSHPDVSFTLSSCREGWWYPAITVVWLVALSHPESDSTLSLVRWMLDESRFLFHYDKTITRWEAPTRTECVYSSYALVSYSAEQSLVPQLLNWRPALAPITVWPFSSTLWTA